MKINELRELTVDELNARARELRKESLHLRIQRASGQLENMAVLKERRQEVAQILTLISERRLGIDQARAARAANKTATKAAKTGTAAPKKATEKKAETPKKPAAKKAPAKKAAKKTAE